MKTKEELNALKEEMEVLSTKLTELNETELEEVAGGLGKSNPVAGMSFDEAFAIALKLGPRQKIGTGEKMSGLDFLEWWKASNPGAIFPNDVYAYFGEQP